MIGASEPWFRVRQTDHGTSYDLTHWRGAVAVLLVAIFAAAIGLALLFLLGRTAFAGAVSLTVGVVLFCALLLSVVRLTSVHDDDGRAL